MRMGGGFEVNTNKKIPTVSGGVKIKDSQLVVESTPQTGGRKQQINNGNVTNMHV